jgi:hypothetical protein
MRRLRRHHGTVGRRGATACETGDRNDSHREQPPKRFRTIHVRLSLAGDPCGEFVSRSASRTEAQSFAANRIDRLRGVGLLDGTGMGRSMRGRLPFLRIDPTRETLAPPFNHLAQEAERGRRSNRGMPVLQRSDHAEDGKDLPASTCPQFVVEQPPPCPEIVGRGDAPAEPVFVSV